MSMEHSEDIPVIELDYDQAKHYLKRESLRIKAPPGWAIVTFQKIPLGWVKSLGNRLNNHYSKSWRIRADISLW